MVQLPRNEKQIYRLNSRPQMTPSLRSWPCRLPWIFKVRYGHSYILARNGPIATKQKANILTELLASNVIDGIDLGHDHDFFFMSLTLNLKGQTWNLLYLNQKWSDCHETKSKHIDWILGLKYDHWVWPWPWIFKVKYELCYISAKNGLIATKHWFNSRPQMWPSGLTLAMTLPWIFKVKYGLCYISSQNDMIATKQWANKSIQL